MDAVTYAPSKIDAVTYPPSEIDAVPYAPSKTDAVTYDIMRPRRGKVCDRNLCTPDEERFVTETYAPQTRKRL